MPSSNILPFANQNTGTNLLTDAEYSADAHRPIGNQPGIARAKLVNKALRQSSLMSAALGKFIAEIKGTDVTDSLSHETLASYLYSSILNLIGGTAPSSGYETTGLVAYFPRTTPPMNWLRCNGAAVSRTTYANLFGVIGTIFGPGDGSTTFNLPDLRGEFLRSLDDGRGVDPGRTMGTWQKGSLVALDSPATGVAVNNVRGTMTAVGVDGYASGDYIGCSSPWIPTSYQYALAGSPEEVGVVRPRNVAMLACIKY